jgi:hypothetical protein
VKVPACAWWRFNALASFTGGEGGPFEEIA